jgi:hypothetical protein
MKAASTLKTCRKLEEELTSEEAQQVQGGLTSSIKTSTGGTRDDAHKKTIEIASFSWG